MSNNQVLRNARHLPCAVAGRGTSSIMAASPMAQIFGFGSLESFMMTFKRSLVIKLKEMIKIAEKRSDEWKLTDL